MRCADLRQRLDDYVDGALAAEERASFEAHFVACAECAAELATLRRLLQSARELPAGIAPRRDLWPDLARRLASHPVADLPTRRHRMGMPAYGLAAAATLLVAVGLWFWAQSGHMPRGGSEPVAQYEEHPSFATRTVMPALAVALERECVGASKMLQASVAGRNTQSGAVMAGSLTKGLDELDRSISETLVALRQAPEDPNLVKLLTVRYQQKLALLHSAIEFVEEV